MAVSAVTARRPTDGYEEFMTRRRDAFIEDAVESVITLPVVETIDAQIEAVGRSTLLFLAEPANREQARALARTAMSLKQARETIASVVKVADDACAVVEGQRQSRQGNRLGAAAAGAGYGDGDDRGHDHRPGTKPRG